MESKYEAHSPSPDCSGKPAKFFGSFFKVWGERPTEAPPQTYKKQPKNCGLAAESRRWLLKKKCVTIVFDKNK
jgi:hypothetical protein